MGNKPVEKKFSEISVGESVSFSSTITLNMVDEFTKLSGDENPIHTDDVYAATTSFGQRIAHGMIAGALFSRILGMHLPGPHYLCLSQTLKFKKPVKLNAKIIVEGTIKNKSEAAKTLTIALEMRDADTAQVLTAGEALVQVLA
jgi:acyl dehydratase